MLVSDKTEIDSAATKIMHPGCRSLFRYWESLRAERPCPRKDEVDLRQIVEIVPFLSIIEHIDGSKPWRFRLAGTKLCEMFGHEMTGLDALTGWDNFERIVIGNCLDISKDRLQPCLIRMRFISEHNDVIAAEMIGLPVQTGKHAAVEIFGGIFPFIESNPKPTFVYHKRELVSARMIWTEHGIGDQLLENVGRKAPLQLKVIQGGLR